MTLDKENPHKEVILSGSGLILDDTSPKEMDEKVVSFVENKLKGLTSHQLRNFYSGVLKLKNEISSKGKNLLIDKYEQAKLNLDEEAVWYQEIEPFVYKIKVQLAFNAARKAGNKPLKEFVDRLIQSLGDSEIQKKRIALYNFLTICESIVAYHKFYFPNPKNY